MSKMLVVVFDDEPKAYEGAQALRELHAEGSISVYAAAVVARGEDGKVSVKDAGDEGPIGTALGMMTGALVGMFAGPEGLVLGAASGGLFGASADLFNAGFGVDFIDEVGTTLEPGKVAVVAEMEENWVTPLDTRMSELGGTVIRRYRIDVEDEQLDRDLAAAEAEYEDLKHEISEANEENKAALNAKLDAAKAKIADISAKAEARQDKAKQELDSKIDSIDAQLEKASDDAKARLETTKAKLKKQREERLEKLSGIWQKTKDSLAA